MGGCGGFRAMVLGEGTGLWKVFGESWGLNGGKKPYPGAYGVVSGGNIWVPSTREGMSGPSGSVEFEGGCCCCWVGGGGGTSEVMGGT